MSDRTSIDRSNALAAPLLDFWCTFDPFQASGDFGLTAADALVPDRSPGYEHRAIARYRAIAAELERHLASEHDPLVASDLRILLRFIAVQTDALALDERLMLPYVDLGQTVFAGLAPLLRPQLAADRRSAIAGRLRKLTGLDGSMPLQAQLAALWRARAGDADGVGPTREQVERDLAQGPRLAEEIAGLFAVQGLGEADAAAALGRQIDAHGAFVRAEVLPRCRAGAALPPQVYRLLLRLSGVDDDPETLSRAGRRAFAQLQDEMNALAAGIARERGLAPGDYRSVLRALKREQIAADDLCELYTRRNAEIEAILRRERLVTVPERGLVVRFATPAEDIGIPAPHYNPPPMLDDRGETGEFVISRGAPGADGAAVFDDFSYEAVTWSLCAHEARPGHDLQFVAMVDGGVSVARAIFAFNSANCEGWALYAEDIVYPYMPREAQLASLQMRLLRAGRLFMDPEIQLGRLTPAEADRILREEIIASEADARSEVQRYTFILPGQATSYYYGYAKLIALRDELLGRLDGRFEPRAFHDFILAQGLVPPDELRAAAVRAFA